PAYGSRFNGRINSFSQILKSVVRQQSRRSFCIMPPSFLPGRPAAVRELILITISGIDRPAVTSTVTSILAKHKTNILDIGQAVIHENLTLGLLVEFPAGEDSAP